eukprot:6159864-Pleurochrysis_carterae.AAC.1
MGVPSAAPPTGETAVLLPAGEMELLQLPLTKGVWLAPGQDPAASTLIGGGSLLPPLLGRVSLPPIGRLDSPSCTELAPLEVVGQNFADATARGDSIRASKKIPRMEYHPSAAAVYAPLQRPKVFSVPDQTGVD